MKKILEEKINNICSTKYFFNHDINPTRNMIKNAFRHLNHENEVCGSVMPKIVDDQHLRNLRCKRPLDETMAYCPECGKSWSSTEFLSTYVKQHLNIPNSTNNYDSDIARLKKINN
jgi:hypothetical protein